MKSRLWPSVVWAVGLLLVWIGERLLGVGTARLVISSVGAAAVVLSVVTRAVAMSSAEGKVRTALGYLTGASSLGILGLGLYGAQLALEGRHGAYVQEAGVALGALWPAVLLCAGTLLLFLELASATVNPEALEIRRLKYSAASGAVIALSIVFACALNYVGSEIPWHWDANKFRVAHPTEATRNQLKALDGPVEATAYFQNPNEVREEVMPYLEALAQGSDKLKVSTVDHALEPAKAKAQLVSGNGYVVFTKGAARESVFVGADMTAAKSRLGSLDSDVRKAFLSLARGPRVVYFVGGHGERESDNKDPADTRGTIRVFRQALTEGRYTLKDLNASTGLGLGVPADAGMVILVGPQSPLLPEEMEALRHYVEGGGKLWLFLDPDSTVTLDEVIGPYGLKFTPDRLLNDQVYIPRDHRPTDMANLVAIRFGSHPSVATLAKFPTRLWLAFIGAGRLEELPKKVVVEAKTFITVSAMPQTFADTNGNYAFDADTEKRNAYPLAAAVELDVKGKQPGRMLVVADADVFSDAVLGGVIGNGQYLADSLKWLGGEEASVGEVAPPEDVRIQHTRNQDKAWFYSTVVLAPLLVLGMGILVNARRRKAVTA